MAELPREDGFLRAFIPDDLSDIPQIQDKPFREALEKDHSMALTFALILQESLDPTEMGTTKYLTFFGKILKQGGWQCKFCEKDAIEEADHEHGVGQTGESYTERWLIPPAQGF